MLRLPLSTGSPTYQALLTAAVPVLATVFCDGLPQMPAVGGTGSCCVLGPEPSTREPPAVWLPGKWGEGLGRSSVDGSQLRAFTHSRADKGNRKNKGSLGFLAHPFCIPMRIATRDSCKDSLLSVGAHFEGG